MITAMTLDGWFNLYNMLYDSISEAVKPVFPALRQSDGWTATCTIR